MSVTVSPIASVARAVVADAIPRHQPAPANTERIAAHPSIAPLLEHVEPLMPHQARVVEEHAVLADRIDKLGAFVKGEQFGRVESAEAALMLAQLQFMKGYEWALRSRVLVWAGEL